MVWIGIVLILKGAVFMRSKHQELGIRIMFAGIILLAVIGTLELLNYVSGQG